MPQLGETVTEGTITRWFKQVGETIDADEPLFEVSTDKVDSEVPAPSAGVVSEILVPEGETVEVGARLAVISDGAAGSPRAGARGAARRAAAERGRRRAPAPKPHRRPQAARAAARRRAAPAAHPGRARPAPAPPASGWRANGWSRRRSCAG